MKHVDNISPFQGALINHICDLDYLPVITRCNFYLDIMQMLRHRNMKAK